MVSMPRFQGIWAAPGARRGLSQHSHGSSSILFLIPWSQTPPGAAAPAAPSRGKGGGGRDRDGSRKYSSPFQAFSQPSKSQEKLLVSPPAFRALLPTFSWIFLPGQIAWEYLQTLEKPIQGFQLRWEAAPAWEELLQENPKFLSRIRPAAGAGCGSKNSLGLPLFLPFCGNNSHPQIPPFPAALDHRSFSRIHFDSGEPNPSWKSLSQLLVPLPFSLSTSRERPGTDIPQIRVPVLPGKALESMLGQVRKLLLEFLRISSIHVAGDKIHRESLDRTEGILGQKMENFSVFSSIP